MDSDNEVKVPSCKSLLTTHIFFYADKHFNEDMVVFKVPQRNGCVDNIDIPSNISFEGFKFRIVENMDISVNKLNIGYTLSTWMAKESASDKAAATTTRPRRGTLRAASNNTSSTATKGLFNYYNVFYRSLATK